MQDQVGKCDVKGTDAKESLCGAREATLHLVALDTVDMELVRSWRNDYRIWQWCRQNDLISDAEQEMWYRKQSTDPTVRMYKILLSISDGGNTRKDIPVGVCGFTSICRINRRAEFSLYIAPQHQRKGLGEKALGCLLVHGFKNLGLNLIWGEVFKGNPALSMFEAVGFQHEGIRRDFYFREGKFIDAALISIKAEEWNR